MATSRVSGSPGERDTTDVPPRLQAALVDRYTIERELGRGGMATVYLAVDLRHHRRVALKVLNPQLAAALGPERFLREIEFTARLTHPHILPLHDSGEAGGFLYYVMPFVEGESLRDRLTRESQLPLDEALQIAREVADALGYAHGHDVLHRDIKPGNILLESGHAVVADFGIAKALRAAATAEDSSASMAIGTPLYMSPEQAAAERALDGRSDVYALGCVLYEMLAGMPPFQGSTVQAIRARHAVDPVPSLRSVRPSVPAPVEAAIARALAKAPADRFRSATEFAGALASDAPVPGARGKGGGRRWVAVVGAGLVTLSIGGWLAVRANRGTVIPEASVIAVLPFAPVAPDSELAVLGYDLAGTMSASLDGVADLRTVDRLTVMAQASSRDRPLDLREGVALGRRLGASSVVYGTVAHDGGAVRLDLRLYGSDSATPLADPIVVTAPADSMAMLSDSVTRILLKQLWRRGQPPTPSVEAALRTRSVPALRAFLRGERAMAANRWRDAWEAYQEAIQADSTFWLAYQRYNRARGWMSQPVDSAVRKALRAHKSDLPEADRLLVEANSLDPSQQLAPLREATRRFPDNWFLWFDLGDTYLHVGGYVGATLADAQRALERAVELNPRLVPAWDHLAWIYLQRADATAADSAYARMVALNADPTYEGTWQGADYMLQLRLLLQLTRTGGVAPDALMDSVAQDYVRHGRVGTLLPDFYGFPQAQIRLELAARRSPGATTAHSSWWWIAGDYALRGAWDSALAGQDRAAKPADGDWWVPGLDQYRMAVVGAWLGAMAPAEALRRRDRAVEAVAGGSADRRAEVAWLDGMLAFSQGDTAGFARARAAARAPEGVDSAWQASLEGFALALRGQAGAAGDSLAALEWRRAVRPERASARHRGDALSALDRIAAARWLSASGDSAQALRLLHWVEVYWLTTGDVDIAVGSIARLERARIEERMGDAAAAREDYERFLRVYDMPPPAHRQLVEDAKAALGRLAGLRDQPAP
jgi:eukaryotic-like serine/threonine-protein kinase